MFEERFHHSLSEVWHRHVVGNGSLRLSEQGLVLANEGAIDTAYTNAQIDDYQYSRRHNFSWRPPLTFSIRARFSEQVTGTAGFGFWNDPFMMTGARWPTLPRAIWFFYSAPPSNMALAQGIRGWGWKAATIDAWRWSFLALAPVAPIALPLMRLRLLYRLLWPIAQRAIHVSEAHITAPMTDWHVYTLVWSVKQARFLVDDTLILSCTTPPSGPLGLVIWLDNQYMEITPQGRFRHGLVSKEARQWMIVDWLQIYHQLWHFNGH